MEEIRTTEVLDREILEDARKKADRVLKNSGVDIEAIHAEWKVKTDGSVAELERRHADKLATFARNLDDSLPLEKKRKRIAFLDGRLGRALAGYFSHLDQARLEALLSRSLSRAAEVFSGRDVIVEYSGIDEKAAARIVRTALPGIGKLDLLGADGKGSRFTGCLVRSSDTGKTGKGGLSFRATIEDFEAYLLDRKREELVKNLFQGVSV
jgi:V/A-type H+/Na+-transporting ATPase subunit E